MDKKIEEVVKEMEELGYEVTPEKVEALLEWHKANPMVEDAALASNILYALESKGIKITK